MCQDDLQKGSIFRLGNEKHGVSERWTMGPSHRLGLMAELTTASNQNVNSALVHDLENVFGRSKRHERVKERRTGI